MDARLFVSRLATFETNIYFPDSPREWLQSNVNEVVSVAKELRLADAMIEGLANSIYPRMFVYMYATLKVGSHDQALLALEAIQAKWIQLDEISQIVDHRLLLEQIHDFLGQLKTSPLGYNASASIDQIMNLDYVCLVTRILVILHDKARRKLLVTQEGCNAQALLDFSQSILDSPDFCDIRSPILRFAVKLAKKSCLYPTSVVLEDVQHRGSHSICGGSFGDIWEGDLRGNHIAIKVIRILNPDDVGTAEKRFAKEAVLWRQLDHPNVLPFYGVYRWPTEQARMCLVSPWMENGNILQYLRRTPDADRLSLLKDVACGLEYLHSFNPSVVHGDLRGVNILITSSLRACLADFGLSTYLPDSGIQFTQSSIHGHTPVYWQAPELLDGTSDTYASFSADIYAFGCVCYEVFAGRPPFSQLGHYQVMGVIIGGRRPCITVDDTIWRLMDECWQKDPQSRPTAEDIQKILMCGDD